MRKAGFTLVEIMIVVAIIGLLAAIAIPNFVRARNTSQKNTCFNNIRQIESAMQQWALENKKTDHAPCTIGDMSPYLKNNLFPTCPSGGTYSGSESGGGGAYEAYDSVMCTTHGNLPTP